MLPPIQDLFENNIINTRYGNSPPGFTAGPFYSAYNYVGNFMLTKSDVFSFSLFMPTRIKLAWLGADADSITIRDGWLQKYLYGQLAAFLKLLVNPSWTEYGIIHFLDSDLRNYALPTGRTVIDEILSIINLFGANAQGRYKAIEYNCMAGPHHDICTSEFIGTVIRFCPLVIRGIKSVLFRDPHTTMPNPETPYDVGWRNKWKDTQKRFWIYQMVNYNPARHGVHQTTMFAAAWGARKIDEAAETTIVDRDIWKVFEDGIVAVKSTEYGIDEQLLIYFINRPDFLQDSYIVGIIHIIWLFVHKMNVRQLKIASVPRQDPTEEPLLKPFEQITPALIAGDINNIDVLPQVMTDPNVDIFTETYFQEVGCLIKYLDKVLTKHHGAPRSLNSLFQNVEFVQNYKHNVSPSLDQKILGKIYDMAPSRWHLWNFVFDYSHGGNIEQVTLKDFLKVWIGISAKEGYRLDLKNQCDIVSKYYRGGEMFFDWYQYAKRGVNQMGQLDYIHKKLPLDIDLPQDYYIVAENITPSIQIPQGLRNNFAAVGIVI